MGHQAYSHRLVGIDGNQEGCLAALKRFLAGTLGACAVWRHLLLLGYSALLGVSEALQPRHLMFIRAYPNKSNSAQPTGQAWRWHHHHTFSLPRKQLLLKWAAWWPSTSHVTQGPVQPSSERREWLFISQPLSCWLFTKKLSMAVTKEFSSC